MIMNGNSGSIPNYFAQSYSTSEVALYVNGASVSNSTYNLLIIATGSTQAAQKQPYNVTVGLLSAVIYSIIILL